MSNLIFRCCQPCRQSLEGLLCNTLDGIVIKDKCQIPPLYEDCKCYTEEVM